MRWWSGIWLPKRIACRIEFDDPTGARLPPRDAQRRTGMTPRMKRWRWVSTTAAIMVAFGFGPVAALAQSPTYRVMPRSGGGRAATFGTGPKLPAASGARGTAGVDSKIGAPVSKPQTARAGAARPSIGSTAPKSPFRGPAGADPNALPKGVTRVQTEKSLKSGGGMTQGRWVGPRPK